MLSVLIPLRPTPKGRPRFYRGHAVTPKKTRDYEQDVAAVLRGASDTPLLGPLKLTLTFVFVRPPSHGSPKAKSYRLYPEGPCDLDNLVKAIKDAANGILWKDDAQVVSLVAWKIYGDSPHTTLALEPLSGGI